MSKEASLNDLHSPWYSKINYLDSGSTFQSTLMLSETLSVSPVYKQPEHTKGSLQPLNIKYIYPPIDLSFGSGQSHSLVQRAQIKPRGIPLI